MEKALPLKILAVLALVLLGSSVNEGRIVTKCELKAELDAAFGENVTAKMTNNMSGCNSTRDLVAKLVCSVNRTSRFNTSVITTIQISNPEQPHQKPVEPNVGRPGGRPARPNEGRPGGRPAPSNEGRPGGRPAPSNEGRPGGRPAPSNEGRPGGRPAPSNEGRPGGRPAPSNEGRPGGRPAPSNEGRPGGRPAPSNVGRPGGRPAPSNEGLPGGKPRGRRSPPRKPKGGKDKVPPSSSGVSPNVTVQLLGIFQLSDRVACDSGSKQSLNICRMSCSALTDDDIMDDVGCLKTLITKISNTTTSALGSHLLPKKMDFFFTKECCSAVSSSYFADCD